MMKKIIGIFMTIVLVSLIVSVAFGDGRANELIEFCKGDKYLEKYIKSIELYDYNIIGDCAYAVSDFDEEDYKDMYDFMDNYHLYLEENWPDFANDVNIEFTYVGSTENYCIICVWLKLNNGKVMSDYVDREPPVSEISALVACAK